jgi:hypothetical protein
VSECIANYGPFLPSEKAPNTKNQTIVTSKKNKKKIWPYVSKKGPTARQTDLLTVGRNINDDNENDGQEYLYGGWSNNSIISVRDVRGDEKGTQCLRV